MMHPYATFDYVQSLSLEGQAFAVPEWGSAIVSRPIELDLSDVTGSYPMTVLAPDADLAGGLARLREAGFVSAVIVLDDYHRPPIAELEGAFDLVRPFKTHYVVDRSVGDAMPSRHHRYEIKKALAAVKVEAFDLRDHLEQWLRLYENLTKRHGLSGTHDFPPSHHELLSVIPGVTAVGAFLDGELLAAHIWVEDNARVHSHLAASSERGYALSAAYAVNDASIRFFSDARIINFGGGAGYEDDSSNGLARFKMGFTNATSRSYVCGKILDAGKYAQLSANRDEATTFFPAYRAPSFKNVGTI